MTENIVNSNRDNPYLLPNFCAVRNLFFIILLTEIMAILFAITAASNSEQFWSYLATTSLLMLWIALLDAATLCFLRDWLHRQSETACLILSFCIMMAITMLIATITSIYSLSLLPDYEILMTGPFFLARVFTISVVIYFLLLRYLYIQQQWRLNLAAQSRAEIQALQARIRPHFLFNSMNTIASLIEIAPERAERAIEDLSDLFRASLGEPDMSTLGKEIELTESYLAIETLRLGERLQIEWHIDETLLDAEIPSLCIQPLAENAVYHGIEPVSEGGKIVISALQIDNKLKVSVSNPGLKNQTTGQRSAPSPRRGNQMAQDNIRQRLKLVYDDQGAFQINDTKDNYTVSLTMPMATTVA